MSQAVINANAVELSVERTAPVPVAGNRPHNSRIGIMAGLFKDLLQIIVSSPVKVAIRTCQFIPAPSDEPVQQNDRVIIALRQTIIVVGFRKRNNRFVLAVIASHEYENK